MSRKKAAPLLIVLPPDILFDALITAEYDATTTATTTSSSSSSSSSAAKKSSAKIVASKKPSKPGHVAYGLANGRILPLLLMEHVYGYLSIADVARLRISCKLWRAEYAPNKSLLWTRLSNGGHHSAAERKSVGDLAWMLDGAGAHEHFPTSTMPVGVVYPPVPATKTTTSDSLLADDDVKMTPYDIARRTAHCALNPHAPRARFRLEMVQWLYQWTLGLKEKVAQGRTAYAPLIGHEFEYLRRCARWQSILMPTSELDSDSKIPIGASKFGGLPDLPAHLPSPYDQCSTEHADDQHPDVLRDFTDDHLGKFILQLNLADYSVNCHAHNPLPRHGLLYIYKSGWCVTTYYYGGPLTALRRWPMVRRRAFHKDAWVNDWSNDHSLKSASLTWHDIPSLPRNVQFGEGRGDVAFIASQFTRELNRHLDDHIARHYRAMTSVRILGHLMVDNSSGGDDTTNPTLMPPMWHATHDRALVSVSADRLYHVYTSHAMMCSPTWYTHLSSTAHD